MPQPLPRRGARPAKSQSRPTRWDLRGFLHCEGIDGTQTCQSKPVRNVFSKLRHCELRLAWSFQHSASLAWLQENLLQKFQNDFRRSMLSSASNLSRETCSSQVLDAPALQDDFYLNLVDWSAQNVLAVGLGARQNAISKLCPLPFEAAVLLFRV